MDSDFKTADKVGGNNISSLPADSFRRQRYDGKVRQRASASVGEGKPAWVSLSKCPYCGNNPVPHHLYWYNESLNILLTPLRQKLLYNFLTRWIKRRGWDQSLSRFFLNMGETLGIITRRSDAALCKVKRAQVLWEEAQKRGIKMEELLLFGKPFDVYVAEKREGGSGKGEEKQIIFSGLPRPAGYFNHVLDLMDDKWWLKQILQKNHLPVPAGAAVTGFSRALQIFQSIEKPVIVKPRAGSRGRHSTTFVYSEQDLHRAFNIAQQLCHWVMVEEQLHGPVYRATVINFELGGVLRGDPPQVVGDGRQTIAQLIADKNQRPHIGVKDIVADDNVKLFLSRQNLNLLSVITNNQTISLSEKIGVNYGGLSSEDFDICHPDNKEIFVKAAKVLGDPLVGFDFIIPDIAKSYKQQKCGFIEVNSLPFINLHHDPLLGQPRNVAARVWEMMGF